MGSLCINEETRFFDNATFSPTAHGIPQVTHCFRHTILNLIPPIFLMLFSSLMIYKFHKSRNEQLHRKNPTIIRLFTCSFLLFNVIVQLGNFSVNWMAKDENEITLEVVDDESARPLPQFLSLLMLSFSLLLALLLLIGSVKFGLVSSGVLFNYWLLLTVCGIPQFRTSIDDLLGEQQQEGHFSSVVYCLYYIGVVATLLLSFFADRPKNQIITEKTSPEWCVSYPNRITFWWFNTLARIGNRRDLKFDDLYELSERDKSQHLIVKFEKIRCEQFKDYNKRKKKEKSIPNKTTLNNGIEETELLQPNSKEKPTTNVQGPKNAPSIIWALLLTFKWTFLGAFCCKMIYDFFQFVPPILLDLLIFFMEDRSQNVWSGVGIALTMFTLSIIQSMFLHQYFHTVFRMGINIRSILTAAVYRKSLLLSNGARKNRTIGEIVNLMTVDIQRFQDMATWIILLGIAIVAGLVCLVAFIPLNAKLSLMMRTLQQKQMTLKDERLKLLNEMLNGIKVLKLYAWEQSIETRIIAIRQKELELLKKMAYLNAFSSMSWASAPFLVAVATFTVYVLIDPAKNILDPRTTFVAISYFNILRFPLAIFPMVASQAVQCNVSNKRLKTFLAEEEIQPQLDGTGDSEMAIAMHNTNFSWDLDGQLMLKEINLTVKKGSLVAIVGRIGSGKSSLLSAILGEMYRHSGTTGIDGRVAYVPQQAWIQNMTLRDNVLFGCPMDWSHYELVLDTCALQQDLAALPGGDSTEIGEKGINLSGGQKQRISLARAAYSDSDVYLFDDPLSAVDSHVGKHIFEKLIHSENGMLKGKTRILVTHGLAFLKYCDQIIVIKEGQISESGSYPDLLQASGEFSNLIEEYLQKTADEAEGQEVLQELEKIDPEKRAKMDRQISLKTQSSKDETITPPQTVATSPETKSSVRQRRVNEDGGSALKNGEISTQTTQTQSAIEQSQKTKIIEKEEIFTGKVKFNVYLSYLSAVSYAICIIFIFISIGSSILGVLCNIWLAIWTDTAKEIQTGDKLSNETVYRLLVYTALGLAQAFSMGLASIVISVGMIRAGRRLHHGMLSNVLRNAMAWFDVTPLGRIMNRFGKDIYDVDIRIPQSFLNFVSGVISGIIVFLIPILVIPWNGLVFGCLLIVYSFILDVDNLDNEIPRSFMSFFHTLLASIQTLFMICYATPQFVAVIIPLAIFYGYVLRYYVSTSRQLKRLESITRSPIYSYFQESVQGASSIRAYGALDRFELESQKRVDHNITCQFPSIVANRWLAVRLELVGNLIVFFSALSAVLFRDSDNVTPGLAGLSVSYALSVTQTLNWAVRMTSELETNIVAVERIKEYSDPKANEAAMDTPKEIQIAELWPEKGEIMFENLAIRYRPELDLVLKGVTAQIQSKEKIGIIGRTGAGKSSLTLALFRLVESSSGRIIIDDIDIAKLGLRDLRSRLTIVPQDPIIFSGTLRENLDPFSQHADNDIWTALELTHLDEFSKSLPEKLDHKISESGGNLSLGQRQLICLARALLRRPRILVLDEAAASVDIETDHLIQSTIRDQFRDCTVLTIAHRLHSVLDSDRILVFSEGRIVEFDTPQTLFAQPNSVFRSLAMDAGITNLAIEPSVVTQEK